MEKMTITRGLANLKLLDKKIKKAIGNGNYITFKIGQKASMDINPKADLQKVSDLISRRNTIKTAIMMSNAQTYVTVAGEKMTVVEAIDRKTSIELDKLLLLKLRHDREANADHIEDVNADMQRRLDRLLESSMGSDTDDKENKAIVESFEKRNKAEAVDALGIDKVIDEMETMIDEFDSEVDLCLSESNSLTSIEV